MTPETSGETKAAESEKKKRYGLCCHGKWRDGGTYGKRRLHICGCF